MDPLLHSPVQPAEEMETGVQQDRARCICCLCLCVADRAPGLLLALAFLWVAIF